MKKKHLKWVITTAVICIVGLALMGAAGDNETDIVKNLLQNRSFVMENVLFGKITYEEGKAQLKKIEGDRLYNDDLRALRKYRNTDLEKIKKMDIIEMKKKSHIYDRITFSSKIKWTVSGMENVYEETHNYLIGIDVNEGEYKLISFEIQE